jgi:hypothetical protein
VGSDFFEGELWLNGDQFLYSEADHKTKQQEKHQAEQAAETASPVSCIRALGVRVIVA